MKDGLEEFITRLLVLIKDDIALHDATVKLIEASAELKYEQAMRMKERRTHVDQVR
jgi:hypothetical protein